MNGIGVPSISFGDWRKWRSRSRPSQDFDVPPSFGVLGLYVLAASDETSPPSECSAGLHLHDQVVYIGMSTHVEQRLERSHRAVVQYRAQFEDNECRKLWFALWHSDWTNSKHDKPHSIVAHATVALYERALLLAYAKKHGHLPALNKA